MKVEASPAEDNPPENLPPQVNSEPEPEPEDGPDPSSGKIPFKTMTLTWGTLCAGIKETIKPDVPSAIVTGNAIYLVLLLATTICKNWSLAVSGHCGETFQSVIDVITFSLSLFYSVWLLQFLKKSHPDEVQSAYSMPSLVYHTIIGNASPLMWDVMSKFVLAFFFKVQSWKQMVPAGEGMSFLDVLVLVIQFLSYAVLWISMTAIENSYKSIKFICLVSSLQMLIFLVSSVSHHVIYVLNQADVSDVASDSAKLCTFGTNEFVASRILSLGAFIAVRLSCFQFFGFKRKTPFLAYCKDIKETVDALSFASKEELQKVTQLAKKDPANGFGGAKDELPGALKRAVSRAEDQYP